MSVNWSRPIEAVHDDGRVVSATYDRPMDKNHGHKISYDDGDGSWSWCVNNNAVSMVDNQWRIRNVAQPVTTPDELTKRMEAHLRNVVAKFSDVAEGRNPELDEARAIVALLPDPVDPGLLEARKLASSFSNRQDVSHNDYLSGDLDSGDEVQAVLRVIKRGRALERGEG